MSVENFLTNQTALAKEIGVTRQHFSAWKNRKVGMSEKRLAHLRKVTGIRQYILISGKKTQLARELGDFFERELARKILNT